MDAIDKVGATVTTLGVAWLITGDIVQAAAAAGITLVVGIVWGRIRNLKGRR
jgi:hypothetical protein